MVVRDRLHRLLNQLVAFILQSFPVSVFASVDTATMVVVLRGRRGRSGKGISSARAVKGRGGWDWLPVAISRHNIIYLQLLANLLNTEMQGVGLELFAGHVCDDGGWKAHEAGSLVLRGIAPSVALLAAARSIGIGPWEQISI